MAGFGRSNSLSINTGGSSLFGGLNKPTASAVPAVQPATSLFASVQQAPQQQQQQQQQQQHQHQQPQQSSLFGTAQPVPAPATSLFGNINAAQSRPATLTGSALGSQQPGAPAQPVHTSIEAIRGITRFNELPADVQALIQQFDEGIQAKINYCGQIREILPKSDQEITTIAPDVAYIESFLSTIETALDNDSSNIAHLKTLVRKDAQDAALSFRAIENQRLPAQFHYRNGTNISASIAKSPTATALDDDDTSKPVDLMNYFDRRTDTLAHTLDLYQQHTREIEYHLRTMEAGTIEKAQQLTGGRTASRDQRQDLVEALKAIERAILDSAKKVGRIRDDVTKHTLGSVGAPVI